MLELERTHTRTHTVCICISFNALLFAEIRFVLWFFYVSQMRKSHLQIFTKCSIYTQWYTEQTAAPLRSVHCFCVSTILPSIYIFIHGSFAISCVFARCRTFSNAYVYMCRILAAIVFSPSILNFMQHAQCSCINELSQLLCVSHHFASDLFQWKLNAPIYLLAWFRRMLSFCDTPHTWKSASFPCNNWRHFRKMHYNIWKLCCNTKIPHIVLELRKAFLRFVFINSHFDESLLISAQHTWTHTHMQCLLQPFVVVFFSRAYLYSHHRNAYNAS